MGKKTLFFPIKKNLVFILILVLAVFLRVYKLDANTLYGDELTMVYDSYSILKTGHDQTGQFLPLTFRMGAGRPGGYIYFSLPFIALFGPSEIGIRSLSLLSGIGIAVLVYFLARKIFNQKVAIGALALTAISPWEIYLSRAGFETHFALFLALSGVLAFLYAKDKRRLYMVWAVTWGIAFLTYPTFIFTLPLLFLLLIWYRGGVKSLGFPDVKKVFLISVVILLFFWGLALREAFFGGSGDRFANINIFKDPSVTQSVTQKITLERNTTGLAEILRPVLLNRVVEYSQILVKNYVRNLSWEFLYLSGDGNPRHNQGEAGMLYLIELPLLFISLYYLFIKTKRNLAFLVLWILIVPLATMLLGEPHGLRNSLMIPALLLVSAYGISKISKSFLRIFVALLGIQMVIILQRVYFISPAKHADFWSYPAFKAVELASINRNNYDAIYLSDKIDNIEYAYPVYMEIDPRQVIDQYGETPKKYNNVYIADVSKPIVGGRVLVVENAKKVKNFDSAKDIVYSANLEPALVLYEYRKN